MLAQQHLEKNLSLACATQRISCTKNQSQNNTEIINLSRGLKGR